MNKKDKAKKQNESVVAESIAMQNAMPLDIHGHNPAIDYIVKKQAEANSSPKARN